MHIKDILLILVVILVWGLNFVVIKVGLEGMPPFLLGALRFTTLIIPALFIPLPRIKIRWLLAYGLAMNFFQFSFLFLGIYYGMPAGLASLALQAHAFFTLILGAIFLQEHIRPQAAIGLSIAVLGLILIGSDSNADLTLIGLLFTIIAAFSWAIGNIVIKKIKHVNVISLTFWGGMVAIIPFYITSFILEGSAVIKQSLININLSTILAILYLGFVATIVGYSIWGKMLAKYPASLVAPFTLLVPVIGLVSSSFFLDEHLTLTGIIGAFIIMFGLCINVFGDKLKRLIKKTAT